MATGGDAGFGGVRLRVVHGPGLDLARRGLETPAPRSPEVLDRLLRGWGSEVGAEVTAVEAPGEAGVVACVREAAREARAGRLDGVVVLAGPAAFVSVALAKAAAGVVAAGAGVVDLHLSDLRRRDLDPAGSLLARAGARVLHGRGIEGYRWGLAHLAWRHAWPAVATLSYGPDPAHVADLRVPPGPGPHPVAVLLHGGFWLEAWERDLMDGLAVDLARRGWATVNVGYRRVGGGGGWPETYHDVRAAVGQAGTLAGEYPVDPDRLLLVGHSAGGHLALRLAAEPGPARIGQVLALAPLADLAAARADGLGGGAVDRFLGGRPTVEASPRTHLPLGVPQLVVHCADDALVPATQSEDWAEAARAMGDDVTLLTFTTGGHFAPITPGSHAWEPVVRLLGRAV